MTLESNQEFIQGAEVLAAGRTLGLSDDETISLKKQKMRENIDRRRAERAQREGNRAEAEAFLAEDSARFTNKGRNRRSDERIRGVRLEEPYPDPFGGQIQNVYDDKIVLTLLTPVWVHYVVLTTCIEHVFLRFDGAKCLHTVEIAVQKCTTTGHILV